MSGTKKIKNKITSIINTKKITKAMAMIAAAKMKKTEERMRSGRPYSDLIKKVIHHVAQGRLEYKHSYLEQRSVNCVGMIIISSDRGLCGGLNTNLFKKVLLKIKQFTEKNVTCELILFGIKSLSIFKKCGNVILSEKTHFGDDPDVTSVINSVRIILERYHNKKIDQIFIAYNKFHNKILCNPTFAQLLPLIQPKNDLHQKWDYLYESDSKVILDTLFQQYIESQIYQSMLENIASEQAARIISMQKATDNSENRIKELQLLYNKVRQANITQELTEIVAGASAVSMN